MDCAEVEGLLWGERAVDWAAIQQATVRPASVAVLDELGSWADSRLLDVGCGAGDFVALAAGRGALVAGLDASAPLIDIACREVPSGSFFVGDMQCLPFPDSTFDVVTTFNCLHFAEDAGLAISEMIRVVQPGGRVVAGSWGPAVECDAITYLLDLGGLMPPEPLLPSLPSPADTATLREMLTAAGAGVSESRVVRCPWEYPDLSTALRGLLSTGPAVRATSHSGHDLVADTITQSISPYRRSDGSYLLDNTCHYLVATIDH